MGMIWDIGYPLSNLSKNEYFQFAGFYVTGFHVIPKLLLYKPANMYSGFGQFLLQRVVPSQSFLQTVT